MDSTLTKPMPAKRLGELLQEQQEPFSLDAYLVERGYLRKTQDSTLTSDRRKRIPPFPKILKTVLKKIVSVKTASSCEEPVRFSSASSMTAYDSEGDMEEEFPSHQQNHISLSCSDATQTSKFCYFKEQVTVTDRTQECGCLEESKQHSPVSVLDELHSDEGSPFYNHNKKTVRCFPRSTQLEIPSTFTNRLTEESLLSASLWDLLHHTPFEKQDSTGVRELRALLGPASSSSSSQYRKTKRALEQTKQLLFDSAREVLEKHGRNENRLLGAEQMGKIICEQIYFWSKQSGNLTNITQVLSSDFLEPTEKWSDTLPQRREIEIQISNAILEEMEFEIVSELIACNIW